MAGVPPRRRSARAPRSRTTPRGAVRDSVGRAMRTYGKAGRISSVRDGGDTTTEPWAPSRSVGRTRSGLVSGVRRVENRPTTTTPGRRVPHILRRVSRDWQQRPVRTWPLARTRRREHRMRGDGHAVITRPPDNAVRRSPASMVRAPCRMVRNTTSPTRRLKEQRTTGSRSVTFIVFTRSIETENR